MINAVKFIKDGKVVAFPTETVYGLGADATNELACLKIFKIKNRPPINPLIVHVATLEDAQKIGEFSEDALKLANRFWPGPLSIVVSLKPNTNIAKSVTAGLSTIALRIPSHPVALELIEKSGVPIAAPSANPSGYVSPTEIVHVKKHFADNPEVFILDDNSYKSRYGLESTIIDTTSTVPTILREGFITQEVLSDTLGKAINIASSLMEVKAPGMLAQHYSPRTPVRINANTLDEGEIGLNFGDSNLHGAFSLNLSPSGDLIEAAANLYSYLRILDNYFSNPKGIAVAPIPNIAIGAAINDRLRRAAK